MTAIASETNDRLVLDGRTRLPELDGLRGLAIIAVFAYHADIHAVPDTTPIARVLNHAAAAGWVGVRLFFVLSGFLITSLLMKEPAVPGAVMQFIGRRTFRILPAYFAILAICHFVLPALVTMPDSFEGDGRYRAAYWLYLSNWIHPAGFGDPALSHSWSLSVEEQFYLVWPPFFFLLQPAYRVTFLAGVICISFVFRAVLASEGHSYGAYMHTHAQMDALAMGSMLALLTRTSSAWLRGHPLWLLVPTAGLFLVALWQRGLASQNAGVLVYGQLCVALLGVGLILSLLRTPRSLEWLRRAFRFPLLGAIGGLSYAFYLVHLPVLHFLKPFGLALVGSATGVEGGAWRAAYLIVAFTICLPPALALRHFVEEPCMRLRSKFQQAWRMRAQQERR